MSKKILKDLHKVWRTVTQNLQESHAAWKQILKKNEVTQDFCTIQLNSNHESTIMHLDS